MLIIFSLSLSYRGTSYLSRSNVTANETLIFRMSAHQIITLIMYTLQLMNLNLCISEREFERYLYDPNL